MGEESQEEEMICVSCIKLRILHETWTTDRSEENDLYMDDLYKFWRSKCSPRCVNYGYEERDESLPEMTDSGEMVFFLPDHLGHC